MKIGLYIVFSLLFIAAVVVGIYMINPATYSFDVFGIHMPKLPVAVWVAIPVALIVIASVLHMLFHSTKSFLASRRLKSDVRKLEDTLYWSLIKEPTVVNFSNEEFKKASSLLFGSYIEPVNLDYPDISLRLKEVAKVIKRIANGEYVDLKMQKFTKHLSENNPIKIQNEMNHIQKSSDYALKVVDFADKYSDSLVAAALDKIVETKDFYTLKKYAKLIGKERFFKALRRLQSDDSLELNSELLKSFLDEYQLECKDYYEVARVVLEKFEPDNSLSLFKELSKQSEEALPGYLYLLFKYEMIDKAKDILEEHDVKEYKAFRALLTLKKGKYNFKSGDILTADNVCK